MTIQTNQRLVVFLKMDLVTWFLKKNISIDIWIPTHRRNQNTPSSMSMEYPDHNIKLELK